MLKSAKKIIEKADTMNLSWEQETIVSTMNYLRALNLYLINRYNEMHENYENLQIETNKKTEEFKNELQMLRNDIKEIESVRAFKVTIPESWIIKD